MKPLYIYRDQQKLGPFQPDDVQRLLNTGQLDRDDPAWVEGMEDWAPLSTVLPRALAGEVAPLPGNLLRPSITTEEPRPRSFLLDVPLSLLYPLRPSGVLLLLCASAALLFSAVLIFLPHYSRQAYAFGAAILIGGYTVCYYFAYIVQVIRATASGCDEIPQAGDIAAVHEEMTGPLVLIVGTLAGCLAPAGFAFYLVYREILDTVWPGVVLLVLGLLCLPMSVLATTILGSITAGLSPTVVVPAILCSLHRYLIILFCLAGTIVSAVIAFAWLNQYLIPVAVAAMILPFLLYLGAVQARLLGLLFKNSSNRLGWFG